MRINGMDDSENESDRMVRGEFAGMSALLTSVMSGVTKFWMEKFWFGD